MISWFNLTHPLKILSFNQTIAEINHGKSFSRFGEGEMHWIRGDCPEENAFQKNDAQLGLRLKEVLDHPMENLLVGIPHSFRHTRGHTCASKQFWKQYNLENQKVNYDLLNPHITYGDAQISRWFILYEDKSSEIMEPKINKLKSIWQNRDTVIIEGENSKIGVGNDLLENAKTIRRIVVPAKNAFAVYEEILQAALSVDNASVLFLLAIGPTATVLAYDLARSGRQAIDVGHIDIEYEWYLAGATTKQPVLGKTVNEINMGDFEGGVYSEAYEESIIERISTVSPSR